MNDAQTLDHARIASYLRGHLPGFDEAFDITKFASGQSNPTFLIKTPAQDYVLRRKPPGVLLKSAHAVDREFRVQSALQDTAVPVPRMYHLCEDDAVIGSAFYVMEHVPGRHFGQPTLKDLSPAERGRIIESMNTVLATLHQVDIGAVGLADYGAPGAYLARQVARWRKQYTASQTDTLPDMHRLMDRLDAEMPDEDGQVTLVHGDYRIDNMIFDAKTDTCRAVLDWELSTLGHPFADLAGVIMQWQLPPGPDGRGLAGVDRDALGLPSDAAFVAAYCARRGLARVDHLNYFVAFCFFRMGAIIQGVLKRALDGNASNPEQARKLGAYVPVFAEKGLQALDTDWTRL